MSRYDEFIGAYLEAALWSSTNEEGEPLDENYSTGDFAPETESRLVNDARTFFQMNRSSIEADDSSDIRRHGRYALAGHDFWLTQNGHGSGFWDGGWPQFGDLLTKSAKSFGQVDLYVGDDGLIHGSFSKALPEGLRERFHGRRPVVPYKPTRGGAPSSFEARRGETRLDRLRASLPPGYSVYTHSPGDGVTRYRFFRNAPPYQDYFGPDNGIHTALGFKQAEIFAAGLMNEPAGRTRSQSRRAPRRAHKRRR